MFRGCSEHSGSLLASRSAAARAGGLCMKDPFHFPPAGAPPSPLPPREKPGPGRNSTAQQSKKHRTLCHAAPNLLVCQSNDQSCPVLHDPAATPAAGVRLHTLYTGAVQYTHAHATGPLLLPKAKKRLSETLEAHSQTGIASPLRKTSCPRRYCFQRPTSLAFKYRRSH